MVAQVFLAIISDHSFGSRCKRAKYRLKDIFFMLQFHSSKIIICNDFKQSEHDNETHYSSLFRLRSLVLGKASMKTSFVTKALSLISRVSNTDDEVTSSCSAPSDCFLLDPFFAFLFNFPCMSSTILESGNVFNIPRRRCIPPGLWEL